MNTEAISVDVPLIKLIENCFDEDSVSTEYALKASLRGRELLCFLPTATYFLSDSEGPRDVYEYFLAIQDEYQDLSLHVVHSRFMEKNTNQFRTAKLSRDQLESLHSSRQRLILIYNEAQNELWETPVPFSPV